MQIQLCSVLCHRHWCKTQSLCEDHRSHCHLNKNLIWTMIICKLEILCFNWLKKVFYFHLTSILPAFYQKIPSSFTRYFTNMLQVLFTSILLENSKFFLQVILLILTSSLTSYFSYALRVLSCLVILVIFYMCYNKLFYLCITSS